ncbi:MAG TPA: serine hydrolase domain-containing protein [Sphingomicrobium sp.]|nr:serine hydrolase domain-containing protein [Sphingomicrobium sp.]
MTRFAKAALSLSLLIVVSGAAAAQAPLGFDYPRQADPRLSELAKRHDAGIAVGVIRGRKLVWSGYYGGQGDGAPVSKDTLFNVASLTKPLAAETILRLVSEGRLSLDEAMSKHWIDPDVEGDPRHLKLTPALALSHRTGFPNWRFLDASNKLRFGADPGTRPGYSGEGYNYVARFAEKKLGSPFEELVRTRVFEPVGMKSSALTRREWMAGRVNLPIDANGRRVKPDLHEPGDWSAADDLFVTIPDYAAFVISVSKDEGLTPEVAAARRKVLSPTTECPKQPTAPCPSPAGHSLGWEILTFGGRQIFWHTGGDWSESTFAYFYPDTGDGLIAFMNASKDNRPSMLDVFDAVDDPSPIRPALRAFAARDKSAKP